MAHTHLSITDAIQTQKLTASLNNTLKGNIYEEMVGVVFKMVNISFKIFRN